MPALWRRPSRRRRAPVESATMKSPAVGSMSPWVPAALMLVSWSSEPARAADPAPPEPAVQRQVLEDDNVRIEELRVRGVNQRLVVQPKTAGARAYEILPEEPGRDTTASRGAAGQRVWRLLSF